MKPTSRKKQIWFIVGLPFTALLSLAVWMLLIEPNRLVTNRYEISLQRPNVPAALKVAVITDIHIGSPFIDLEKLKQVVLNTNAQNPDLVVLLGDFMVQDRIYKAPIDPEVFAPVLRQFNAPLGTFAVLGNHDWWFDGNRVQTALATGGVRVLENQVAEISKDGKSVWFVGLADLWTRPQFVTQTLAKVPEGATVIAITHNPDLFPKLPASVTLTLAGHTHGGQVCLPWVGRLVVPSDFGQRYAAGHVREGDKHLFVSTGVGTSILPVRLGVPPEIVILTLRP